GYLFTAIMVVLHTLSFPGLFAPQGLLGAGPQTTAWLYMFWHGSFPVFVTAYALLSRRRTQARQPSFSRRVGVWARVLAVAACAASAVGLALLATTGQNSLPPIMKGNAYTQAMIVVVSTVWLIGIVPLAILGVRRSRSALDLWLIVVMCAWTFDIGLSAVFNA